MPQGAGTLSAQAQSMNRTSIIRSHLSASQLMPLQDSLDITAGITIESRAPISTNEAWARFQNFGLAIVGTRESSAYSARLIESVLKDLQGMPLVIVSGLARGIDQVAHRWAIKLGFLCLGWIACGVDRRLTREAEDLRQDILNHGGWIASPFDAQAPAYPSQFLTRNGWIAVSSRAIWVVEAPLRSGALNTAKWAGVLDRQLYVTPCRPGDPVFAGNQLLLTPQTHRAHQAQLLWNADSLSYTWLEIESLLAKRRSKTPQDCVRAPDPLQGTLRNPFRLLIAHHPEISLSAARHRLLEEGYSAPEITAWISDWTSQLKEGTPLL